MLTVSDVMRMKDNNDLEGLLRALRDQDIAVRAEAALSLGGIGDKRAVEPLIATLQDDTDPYVRSLAATALGELGDERARDPLVTAIASDTLDVSMAASKAQFDLEANIARGTGGAKKTGLATSPAKDQFKAAAATRTPSKPGSAVDQPKGKGCAVSFWELIRVELYIFWIGLGFLMLIGIFEVIDTMKDPGNDFWMNIGVIAFFILLFLGFNWMFRRLTRSVSNRLSRLKGVQPGDQPSSAPKKRSFKPVKPQVKTPSGVAEKPGYTDKIGAVDILWVANKQAVEKFKAIAESSGISLREAISSTMGMSGSRDELLETAGQISLSPVRKAWCQTTPIYLDKSGGGVYVLFEELDKATRQEEDLEYLGTLDAASYTAALCMAHGLDPKNVVV